MVGSIRTVFLCFSSVLLLVAGCSSDPPPGTPCETDAFCGAGICRAGRCAARAPAPGIPPGGIPARTATCTGRAAPGGGPFSHSVGDCAEVPYDLGADPSNGVIIDPSDGALVLDTTSANNEVIWIASTEEGTVSKFDTRTYEELGRYRTGPRGGADDPSRTSVNTFGDVYVGNRAGGSVTKISVLGERCPDSNGDGRITTSSGGNDVLPWGEDDCVLWNTDVSGGGLIRAVAAQDVDGVDGGVYPTVWIGGYNGVVWHLDGDTGAILLETEAPVPPYGFALDRAGSLWIATREGNRLGRLDTNRCIDEASCDVPTCMDDSTCIKEEIPMPIRPYGITVDQHQRVWLGGSDIVRYDPSAPAGARVVEVGLDFDESIRVHGIAADAEGWVWGAGTDHGVVRVSADDPSSWTVVGGTTGFSNKGMAVDADGKVWSITRADRAVVVTPGPTLMDAMVDTDVARSIIEPYTYSDMTGQQLRLATNPRGFYRRVFEGCASPSTTLWSELHWNGDAAPGTRLAFRARSSATAAELAAASWVGVATAPPDASPADLAGAFAAEGVTPGRFLELEVQLERLDGFPERLTPRVRWLEVSFMCGADLI